MTVRHDQIKLPQSLKLSINFEGCTAEYVPKFQIILPAGRSRFPLFTSINNKIITIFTQWDCSPDYSMFPSQVVNPLRHYMVIIESFRDYCIWK